MSVHPRRRPARPQAICRARTCAGLGAALLLVAAPIGALPLPMLSIHPEAQVSPMPDPGVPMPTIVRSLDGPGWLLATDPGNVGRDQEWWSEPRPEAVPTYIPWVIQDPFPGYHGVAWYWRDFEAPANPHAGGRYLLRFWAVDYKADVWLNGVPLGSHEGGESVFVFDATDSIKPGATNRLAVRVLNPTDQPIDGIVLAETPHRNKVVNYGPGSDYDHGGIVDSVELLAVPRLRVSDLCVSPDIATETVQVRVTVTNAGPEAAEGDLALSLAPAAAGETVAADFLRRPFPPGESTVELRLPVPNPHLWQLNDPFLYRVTARLGEAGSASFDEASTRCGFRTFTFENRYFRLNGRRIFLKCSHTGNCCPIGLHVPLDPDILRRDLLNVKVMGFNAIRFIAGVATRYQLDLCDEIGLMVYEEPYAGWCLADSPHMAERYDESLSGMIRRDRNHPSLVMWGLLNETGDGPVLRHAAAVLPRLRELDPTRMVMLNSGRWDAANNSSLRGLQSWRQAEGDDPNVTRNPLPHPLTGLGVTWAPGQMAFHPGRNGEYSVVAFTSPAAGEYAVSGTFASIAEHATTDVHVLHGGKALFDGGINVQGGGPRAEYTGTVTAQGGDLIACAVGYGNGNYGADTTALAFTIRGPGGQQWDAATDFALTANPNVPWSYGWLAPAPAPDLAALTLYPTSRTIGEGGDERGTLSNPGTAEWQDVLSDQHQYPRVPHTADTIAMLRHLSGGANPVFLSEYGIGSAVRLPHVVARYEQLGKGNVEDAQLYRGQLQQFLADWERWHLSDTFASPGDYFDRTLAKMAKQRLLGLNAIRSNPNMVGHSLTGTVDQGWTGEGLTTTFREFKPGTVDALADGLAPLRLCLFAEPEHVYRGTAVHLEAVLANENALLPGEYTVRLQVAGPNNERLWEQTAPVTVPEAQGRPEPPFATAVFAGDVPVDAPSGRCRFLATFERGAAAAGGEAELYVSDPAEMPPVDAEVVLWGVDESLARWLTEHGVRTRPFDASRQPAREVILAGAAAPPPGGAEAFAHLAQHMACGSVVVFLCPEVFAGGDNPLAWVPLANKGTPAAIGGWLYLKDEWAKAHPIFDGLPTGLLDYTFYREIIPDALWSGQDAPDEAVAGAIKSSQGYASGLMVATCRFGEGRFVLNTLRIRENLGTHPVAERLLRNMLRYAAAETSAPPAALPGNFAETLRAIGYAP